MALALRQAGTNCSEDLCLSCYIPLNGRRWTISWPVLHMMTEGEGHRNPRFAADLDRNEEHKSVNKSFMRGSIGPSPPGLAVCSDTASKARSTNLVSNTKFLAYVS